MRIALTGSFAGQDSLGDECLLKAVVARIQHHRPYSTVEFQLNDPGNAFIAREARDRGFEVARGLQYSMYRMGHVLERCKVPAGWSKSASERGMSAAATLGMFGAADAIERLKRADAFFVFGGTQFSGQWFALNAPSYLKSAEIVRGAGGNVYFGPQQYGPLAEADAAALRNAMATTVTDWRTRNPLDSALLESDTSSRAAREVYDEVFSATRLYPTSPLGTPEHILFNLRHTTFDSDVPLDASSYRGFAALVDALVTHFALPAVFFGVSGATFCDDDAAFASVKHLSRMPERLHSVGRVRDEHHLFELASRARAVVSMSFHGCILAGIAGAPFVPVTEGHYYDYKYAGFDKYAGGQRVPVVGLVDCDPVVDLRRIVDFVDGFDPSLMLRARAAASDRADDFYLQALAGP